VTSPLPPARWHADLGIAFDLSHQGHPCPGIARSYRFVNWNRRGRSHALDSVESPATPPIVPEDGPTVPFTAFQRLNSGMALSDCYDWKSATASNDWPGVRIGTVFGTCVAVRSIHGRMGRRSVSRRLRRICCLLLRRSDAIGGSNRSRVEVALTGDRRLSTTRSYLTIGGYLDRINGHR